MILANDIKNDDELCVLAELKHTEGKSDTLQFVMSHSERQWNNHIRDAWKVKRARQIIEWKRKTNFK